jgi:hypothetical protein
MNPVISIYHETGLTCLQNEGFDYIVYCAFCRVLAAFFSAEYPLIMGKKKTVEVCIPKASISFQFIYNLLYSGSWALDSRFHFFCQLIFVLYIGSFVYILCIVTYIHTPSRADNASR